MGGIGREREGLEAAQQRIQLPRVELLGDQGDDAEGRIGPRLRSMQAVALNEREVDLGTHPTLRRVIGEEDQEDAHLLDGLLDDPQPCVSGRNEMLVEPDRKSGCS